MLERDDGGRGGPVGQLREGSGVHGGRGRDRTDSRNWRAGRFLAVGGEGDCQSRVALTERAARDFGHHAMLDTAAQNAATQEKGVACSASRVKIPRRPGRSRRSGPKRRTVRHSTPGCSRVADLGFGAADGGEVELVGALGELRHAWEVGFGVTGSISTLKAQRR